MTGCSDGGPSIDLRCDDPAFADANPEICNNFARLFLVPDQSVVEVGSVVTYAVILRQGAKEFTISLGVEFSVADDGVAQITSAGVATGVTAGSTSITATWQGLTAHAELRVVQDCAELNSDFLILIDNSKSMTQAMATAASKLAFSKLTASAWCDTVNYSKDRVGAMRFNDAATLLIGFQSAAAPVKTVINSVPSSVSKTDIADGLTQAIDYFAVNSTADLKLIVFFGDGEINDGTDPVPIAKAFKDSGGIIVVVATRAWGTYFETLNKIASAGFFISAYAAIESSVLNTLSGLKSLVCSGKCVPEAGTFPKAQLNYTGFINWDVTAGRVDLCGLGLWDVQPGNGLYVDLQGTGDEGYPPPGQVFGFGQLTTKDDIAYVDGEDYRFSIDVGGSSHGAGTWTIRIRVGNGVDETITITDGATPFATHEFEWTQSGDYTGKIIIEQTVQTGHHNVGTLIDNVLLENVTHATDLFEDNFDSENPTVIEPEDGGYWGCLDTAPGSQTADPTPLTPLAEGS